LQLAYDLPWKWDTITKLYPGPSPYEFRTYQDHIFKIIMAFQPRRCLEIGLMRGDSTEAILMALSNIGPSKLISVDPCDGGYAAMRVTPNIRNGARWEHIRSTSQQAAENFPTEPYEFIYIDGDHEYDGVKHDWERFGPRAPIVLLDDVNMDGPSKLMDEIRKSGTHEWFIYEVVNEPGHQQALLRRRLSDAKQIIRPV